jgi:hypothetical protein
VPLSAVASSIMSPYLFLAFSEMPLSVPAGSGQVGVERGSSWHRRRLQRRFPYSDD